MTPKKKNGKKKKRNLQSVLKKGFKAFWFWILVFLIIAGGIVSVDYFSPRVSISPDISLNPYNPINTTFQVKNNGNFSISDFKSLILCKKIIDTRHVVMDDCFTFNPETIDLIKPGRSTTITSLRFISKMFPGSIISANIVIEFTYKPYFFYTVNDNINFRVLKSTTGKYHWSEF